MEVLNNSLPVGKEENLHLFRWQAEADDDRLNKLEYEKPFKSYKKTQSEGLICVENNCYDVVIFTIQKSAGTKNYRQHSFANFSY